MRNKVMTFIGVTIGIALLFGRTIPSEKNQVAVRITHTAITENQLQSYMSNDGAGSFINQFSNKVFVYKLRLVGGGGYYSSTLLRLNLNKTPAVVIGKGTSDDAAAYRVSVGADSSNMYGFNGRGWVNLTSYWTSNSMYILLDSKWGTNYDTELDLWMAFSGWPLDTVITYDIIRYDDSFGSFEINSYQVYVNPDTITIHTGGSFTNDLNADGASSYASNFTGNYAYRIDVWGGGGYHSECILKLYMDKIANFTIAKGTSDANDNVIRTGVGREINHLIDVQQPTWVDVTSEFQDHYTDLRLNSKWGTNNDSHIIIWLSTDQEIENLGYSIVMFPEGLGSIEIKKYNLGGGGEFTLPFSDNFDDGDDSDWSWYTWIGPYPSGQPSHEVVNGVERIVTHDQNNTMLANGTSTLSNYYIEADERIVQLLDDAYGGLRLYAYSNGGLSQECSYYILGLCHREQRWGLGVHYADGNYETLAQGYITINLNQWYHMKVEVRGDTVFGYLDGQLLGYGVPSHPLSGGMFGFGGSDDIIEVDNVHVDHVGTSNRAPTASTPSGPSSGNVGQSLTYTSTVTDPDGDNVYVQFVWGDGDTTGWIGPHSSGYTFSVSHSWSSAGTYHVKARGKDSHGNIGDWSSPVTVTIQSVEVRDTLVVTSVNAAPGSQVTVPLNLINSDYVGGTQFKIVFDSSIVTFDSIKLTSRASGFTSGSNILGGDTLIVMIYSSSGDTIMPGSGAIVNLYMTASQNVNFGDSTRLDLMNTLLSDPGGHPIPIAEVDGWINFRGRKGDVNQDGNINIFDVVRAVNIALNVPPPPTPYERWAADMDDNGTVNIFDIVRIVNIILSGGKACAYISGNTEIGLMTGLDPNDVKTIDTLKVVNTLGNPGSTVAVPIELFNTQRVSGVQYRLYFDSSIVTFDSVKLASRASSMTLGHNVIGGDTLIALIYSASGNTISAGSGAITTVYFTLHSNITGDSTQLVLAEALVSDSAGSPVSVIPMNGWILYGQGGGGNDTLRVASTWGPPGNEINVPIVLNHQDAVMGVQTTILVDSSILNLRDVTLNPAYSSRFSISSNNFGDSIKVVVISMSGDSIIPGEDTVFSLNFTIDSNATLGDSTFLDLTHTVLSDPQGNHLSVTGIGGWVYIRGLKGDLNLDGEVDVTDAVREINIIIGRPPAPTNYERWAGDMNNDGEIDVTDAVMIINVIIGRGKGNANIESIGNAEIWIEDGKVMLNNNCAIAGLQFDLIGNVRNVELTGKATNMRLFTRSIPGGVRVVVIGLDGSTISLGQGAILRLTGEAKLEKVVISDVNGYKVGGVRKFEFERITTSDITPNPVKDYGTIEFTLPKKERVRINVFDVTGRNIMKLVDREYEAGIHDVRVNFSSLPDGIYFIQFRAGGHSSIRKFVVRR